MSEAIVAKQPKTLKEYIEVKRPEIAAMLPSHINVERFLKSALLAVARDPKLQQCSPLSLFTAVVNAAELGLDFTPSKGAAYIVKFGDKATFMPGYRGFIDLAKRTGDVKKIEAVIVRENDRFEIQYGLNPDIDHKPPKKGERGQLIGVYAVATFKDGEKQFDYMTREEIDAIRKRSKASGSGPWVTDYEEMARKTVVRRLFKYLPSSSDLLDKALEADNEAIGFGEIELEPMEDGEKTSRLAEKLAAKPEPEEAKFEDVPPEPTDPPIYRYVMQGAPPPLAEESRPESLPESRPNDTQGVGHVKALLERLGHRDVTMVQVRAIAKEEGIKIGVPQNLTEEEAGRILGKL